MKRTAVSSSQCPCPPGSSFSTLTEGETDCPVCPVCGGGSRQYFEQGETDFQICLACGVVWRYPLPTESELNTIYRESYATENLNAGGTNQESGEFATRKYERYIVSHLARRGDKVLDYGAATGLLVKRLRARGVLCDGYEPSEEAREYGRNARELALYSSAQDISTGQYDLITLIEVIEHVHDPDVTLMSLRSWLRPGGVLFLTTPNRRGWRARFEKGRWEEARKKFHLYLFDQTSLAYLLEKAGFVHVKRVRFSPITMRGLLRRLVGRGTQAVGLGGTLCMLAERSK